MAGMQRFVTYIYEYEDGQKADNVGYAKIETRGERGQIEIHFLNGRIYRGKGEAAFLFAEKGKLIYIPVGEFSIENGVGKGAFRFQTNILAGTAIPFAKIDGIYIADSENRKYLSLWKDVDITDFTEDNFVKYSPGMAQTEESVEDSKQKQPDKDIQQEIINEAEQESLHTMEIPMRNIFPDYTMEEIWKNFMKTKSPVQVNNRVSAIQIELNDLRELPKQYWYLGNNSFLLHGFFNYRHLLFGRLPEGKWFIGVPGVYAAQEQVMASVFGFRGFMEVLEETGEMGAASKQEMPRERQRGIWYHILED